MQVRVNGGSVKPGQKVYQYSRWLNKINILKIDDVGTVNYSGKESSAVVVVGDKEFRGSEVYVQPKEIEGRDGEILKLNHKVWRMTKTGEIRSDIIRHIGFDGDGRPFLRFWLYTTYGDNSAYVADDYHDLVRPHEVSRNPDNLTVIEVANGKLVKPGDTVFMWRTGPNHPMLSEKIVDSTNPKHGIIRCRYVNSTYIRHEDPDKVYATREEAMANRPAGAIIGFIHRAA